MAVRFLRRACGRITQNFVTNIAATGWWCAVPVNRMARASARQHAPSCNGRAGMWEIRKVVKVAAGVRAASRPTADSFPSISCHVTEECRA